MLELLCPPLAIRAAHALFCTPLPLKWLQRRALSQHDWSRQRWRFERTDLTVYGGNAPHDAPVVVLVHGWGGHVSQMLPLARMIIDVGMRPVIVEMPAHGMSGGGQSSLPQFARALDYVVARLNDSGQPVQAVVSHSLGANASAYAVSRGLPVKQLVLIAPPASPMQYTRLFAHVFALRESTRAAMQCRIESREAIMMRQFEPDAVGARIAIPVLVVHDRADRINPFTDGEAFAREIAGAQLLATESLGHRRVLSHATVLDRVSSFLRSAQIAV
jgi:pimeloyl-ACP methyl ester carboxylesterase